MSLTGMFIMFLVSIIITDLTRKIPDSNLKKMGLDDFDFPTVSEDRVIPVVVGDVLVEGPNVTWYGDYLRKKLKESAGMIFKKSVTVGYQYYVGMELALCWGEVDSITEVHFGDKVAWTGNVTADGDSFLVSDVGLYGGKKKGGGVHGNCVFYKGTSSQAADSYMTSQTGEAYQHAGVSKIIWEGPNGSLRGGGLLGEQPIVRAMKFRVQVYPNYLGSSYKNVGGQANPAEVIYMLLTGRYTNLQLSSPVVTTVPDALIDKAQFLSVASQLNSDGMGISFQWQRDTSPGDLIADILRHVDGILRIDYATGKAQLKLFRDDYDFNTAREFNDTNVEEVTSFTRTAPDAAVNVVVASYKDIDSDFKSKTVKAQDLGNLYEQGNVNHSRLDLDMFTDEEVARSRAMMELLQLGSNITAAKIVTNREGFFVNLGDVVKFSRAELGIYDMPMRVMEKEEGDINSRQVVLTLLEDVFGVGETVYAAVPGTAWVDPIGPPVDVTEYRLDELPHYVFSKTSGLSPYLLMCLAEAPSQSSYEYDIYLDTGTSQYSLIEDAIPYLETTTLSASYLKSTAPVDAGGTLIMTSPPPIDFAQAGTSEDLLDHFYHWILVDDEFMCFETFTDLGGTYQLNNVYRGMLDTVPEDHNSGATVWWLQEITYMDSQRSSTEAVQIKMADRTFKGTLSLPSATARGKALTQRYDRFYPPGYVQVNNVIAPTSVTGDITINWLFRNRTILPLVSPTATSQPLETNQVCVVELYKGGLLWHTSVDQVGTGYTYTEADELIEHGSQGTNFRLDIYCEDSISGLKSSQTYSHSFTRVPTP